MATPAKKVEEATKPSNTNPDQYSAKLSKPAVDKEGKAVPNSGRTVTVTYKFGKTLEENRKMFGDDVVNSRFHAAAVIDLQALVRRGISSGKNDQEIQTLVSEWKPGVKQVVRKDPKAKAADALSALDEETRKALLAEFAAKMKAGK